MIKATPQIDLARTTFIVLCIGLFTLGSLWVLKPFVSAFLWASLIVIPLWPLMLNVTARLGGRRGLTVTIFSGVVLIVVAVPMWVAISSLVDKREEIRDTLLSVASQEVPPPPNWIRDIPLVGATAVRGWEDASSINREELLVKVSPYIQSFLAWCVAQIGSAGIFLVHLVLTVVLSAVLFMQGEVFAKGVQRLANRIAGERGLQATILAAQAIKAVAMGVVVTALFQGVVAALGLWLSGIPAPVILGAVIFFLGIIQIGAGPVLIPSIIWLFWSEQTGSGILLVIFSVLIMSIDNVLRPLLIRRGANLPLLLIFAGVIGGLFAFGIIGLFIGPTILAISFTLVQAWIDDVPSPEVDAANETKSGEGVPASS